MTKPDFRLSFFQGFEKKYLVFKFPRNWVRRFWQHCTFTEKNSCRMDTPNKYLGHD